MAPPRNDRLQEVFNAAIDLPVDRRGAFLRESCAGDETLLRDVAQLLELHDRLPGEEPNHAYPTSPGLDLVGEMVGPYRVVQLLGSGGMGRVYLASRADGAFSRRVAIKVVRPDAVAPETSARFEEECRILASLHHPGIAGLLDAGRTPNGSLYIVLEYVDGAPITTYCGRHGLAARARIALFRRVCDAVSFAHSNLVVHRDLKPANVLVDADGAPKLLDFGIAKVLTPAGLEASPPTHPLQKRATRAYASPEQLRGEPANTGMDLYALGVILHELLTGARPQAVGSEDTTSKDRPSLRAPSRVASESWQLGRHDGVPPSELDADLEAVVLKAVAVDPLARYRSVDALSHDLDAYLASRPVSARKGTRVEAAMKFVRRNRAITATAAAGLAMCLVAIISLSWLWTSARREREAATTRFQASRELARAVFAIDESLAGLAGATAAREALIGSFTAYLRRLSERAEGDSQLSLEIAESYRRVGDALGNPNQPNLGNRPKALENYEAATAILRRLAAASGASADAPFELANTRASAADVLTAESDYRQAEEAYGEALAIAARLDEQHPTDTRYRAFTAGLNRSLGDVALLQDDPNRALPLFERAVATEEALVRMSGSLLDRKRFVALSRLRVASALAGQGMFREAQAESAEAIAQIREVRQVSGDAPDITRDLAVALADVATRADPANPAAGDQAFQESLDMLQRLEGQDPADARVRRDLIVSLVEYGDFLRGRDLNAATARYRQAEDLALAPSAQPIRDEQAEHDLAVVRQRLSAEPITRPLDLQLFAVAAGSRKALGPTDHLPAGADRITARPVLPPQYVPYIVLFGARGQATILDEPALRASQWTLPVSGPPPAQTILLIALPKALTSAERDELTADLAQVTGPRTVDWDAQIVWASDGEDRIVSQTTTRGSRDAAWTKQVRGSLDKLKGIHFVGRTFPIGDPRTLVPIRGGPGE